MAIIDVVKFDGNGDVFAWKFPNSELATWTQLIVNESQEAVLYKGGQALDWYGPGRHTLDTANIPLLNNIINLPFGGNSPFTAEVWFVNKVDSLDVKWGTPTPMQLQDPKYNVFIPVRAYGQFGIRIVDAKLFLKKFVGTMTTFTSADIIRYLRGAYITIAKDHISSYLVKNKVSILEISSYLSEISESLKTQLSPIYAEYGIELINFYVNDISTADEDSAVITLKDALAKKAEMDIIGYSYTQERSFDTLEGAAKNTGSTSAQVMGAGIGMGMGVGIGGNMNGSFGELSENIKTQNLKECSKCGNKINVGDKFCANCGNDTTVNIEQITCNKCGNKNQKGTKFCGECGNKLVKQCSKCNEIVADNQKFCPNCGTPMAKVCGNCGKPVADNLKFCGDCGSEVVATS